MTAKKKPGEWVPEKPENACSCLVRPKKQQPRETCGRPAVFRVRVVGELASLSFVACEPCARKCEEEAKPRKVFLEKISERGQS